MTNKNLFKQTAVELTTLSDLMENREKGSFEDYALSSFHITDFDMINLQYEEPFGIITIAEDDNVFIFCGLVLTNIITSWIKKFDGDITACREEYKKTEPLEISVEKVKTKNNRTVTKVFVKG